MDAFYLWPEMPAVSIALLIIGSMLFLFLAREPIHKAFDSLAEGTAGGLKKMGQWANNIAQRQTERNIKVLLESGMADASKKLQEEFLRVEASYGKHLSGYPTIQRRLDDFISKIETDYKECGQANPEAPGWNEAVSSLAKVQGTSGDRVIEKMLSEIHKSAIDGEKRALTELRNTTAKRHKVLSAMAPIWKKVQKSLNEIGDQVAHVLDTTKRIDKYMDQFEKISKGDDDSIEMLSSRATKLFIASALIILVAGLGAWINFEIIAPPMAELIPNPNKVLGLITVSKFSALVIIMIEIFLGIFLMEALGITNIIPQIAMMPKAKRQIILYACLLFLFVFSCIEASLGVLRELIFEADLEIQKQLSGDTSTAAVTENSIIKQMGLYGQAGLGFILPWVLAMVAMPLELLIESSQHTIRKILIFFINSFANICKMLAYLIEYALKIIMHLYDAYIIIPSQLASLATSKAKE